MSDDRVGRILSAPEVEALLVKGEAWTYWPVTPMPPGRFDVGDVAPVTNGRQWAISKRWLGGADCWPPGQEALPAPVKRGQRLALPEAGGMAVRVEKLRLTNAREDEATAGDPSGAFWFWAVRLVAEHGRANQTGLRGRRVAPGRLRLHGAPADDSGNRRRRGVE